MPDPLVVPGAPGVPGAQPALVLTQQSGPLIERVMGDQDVPASWCVVVCEQGCQQSWAVDSEDFSPRLTASDVERLLTPLLLEHEQEHQGVWR